MAYEPKYTKPYTDGWKNLPEETTPITAEVLNAIDTAMVAAEEQLKNTTAIYDESSVNFGRKADTAIGGNSVALGGNLTVSGLCALGTGAANTASGAYSQAHGTGSTASANYAHADGANCTAEANFSYARGNTVKALGAGSHVEGYSNESTVNAKYSFIEGKGNKSDSAYQHVQGLYNEVDSEQKYAHIVGGGTSDDDRKNIHTLDWNGNAEFAGEVKDGNGNTLSGKVDIPLSAEGSANYGTSGQVLQTNGDGTMEWVEVGLSYDETLALLNAEEEETA